MLNFTKVIAQIEKVGVDSLTDRLPDDRIVIDAQAAYEEAGAAPAEFKARLEANAPLVLWPVAVPLEPLNEPPEVAPMDEPVSVVAVDGSQIMPSHHEVYSCYLLNMGIAVISYGRKMAPILDSEPMLYHRPEDLYPLVDRRRIHIDELYVSLERNLLELETLAAYAIGASDRALPVVALSDGSLIPWSLEKMPDGYQRTYTERTTAVLSLLKAHRIPLIGYLSNSRSCDLVNALRVWRCPYPASRCRDLCGHLNEEDFPCSTIWPLADRQLLRSTLKPRQRTAVFLSGAGVGRALPAWARTCFVYVHVGFEVARLELPRWTFEDAAAFALALSTVVAQVEKGQGYPVSLSEAHNLAVIKSADRERFFELIARRLVTLGVRQVGVSPKESRKRHGII